MADSHKIKLGPPFGRVPWNKGLKIGDRIRKKTLWFSKPCFNCGNDFYSYPSQKRKYCSPSCRSKYTKASERNPNVGKKTGRIPKSAFKKGRILTREEIKKCLKRRPMSSLEIKIQNIINKHSLPYKFVGNGKFFIERKNPDFININGEKRAVEVYTRRHKDYFSGGTEQWKKERQKLFSKYGWEIIFIEDWQTNKEEVILNLLKGGY